MTFKNNVLGVSIILVSVYVTLNFSWVLFTDSDPAEKIRNKINQGKITLFDTTKDEYIKKINEARRFFRIEPEIRDPFFLVKFDTGYYNAEYDPRIKSIIINKEAVEDLSIEELAALIAHEMAHAEFYEKTGKIHTNTNHWQVDVRGAELTNYSWMESLLVKLDKQTDDYYSESLTWLKAKGLIFLLAYYMADWEYNERKEELGARIVKIRESIN